MTVHEFLYNINPRAVWPGLLSLELIIGGAAAMWFFPPEHGVWTGRIIRGAVALLLLLAAVQCCFALLYLFYPLYLDFAEPQTAAVSWLVWHGHSLYPPLATGDLYAPVFGPILYQVNGAALLLLGPSIFASKLPGVLAFAAAEGLVFLCLRRSGAAVWQALAITAALCVVQAGFGLQAFAFGVRADPWLFLLAAAATLVATLPPTLIGAAVLGALAGLAANIKADAALYIVPLAVLLVGRAAPRARVCLAAMGLGAGIAIFALPFTGAGVKLPDYLSILGISSHRPLSLWLVQQNIVLALLALAPLAWLYRLRRIVLPDGFTPFLQATLMCMALVLVPASYDGAGAHHFLPFLPSLCWAFVILLHSFEKDPDMKPRLQDALLIITAALVVGYGPIALQSWDGIARTYGRADSARRAAAEVTAALAAHPGVKLAVGPDSAFEAASMRVLPVFAGNPLPIDMVTWTEYQAAGRSDAILRTIFRECRAGIWLLQHGRPFEVSSYYNAKSIFSPAALDAFHQNYRLIAEGAVYDQWGCNRTAFQGTQKP